MPHSLFQHKPLCYLFLDFAGANEILLEIRVAQFAELGRYRLRRLDLASHDDRLLCTSTSASTSTSSRWRNGGRKQSVDTIEQIFL